MTGTEHPSGLDPPAEPDPRDFADNPLRWLLQASRNGPLAVVSRSGPLLSRATTSNGTVAVFGPDAVRQVLGNIDTFGMPVSVSASHDLPATVANLNSALFSMTGSRHRSRQQLLARILGPPLATEHEAAIDRGITAFLQTTPLGRELRLTNEMRRLARLVAEQLLLGTNDTEGQVGRHIQRYFDQRRRYASRDGDHGDSARGALVEQGTRVDALLRGQVRALRGRGPAAGNSVLGRLCRYADDPRLALTEDELVAHANVLFMSSSEPIATAMTWILLALSQRPQLLARIRAELQSATTPMQPSLRGTVREVLRLTPPSAIMVRLTRREAYVAGWSLPSDCEVIICPFAEHRRPEAFPEPHHLRPERWTEARPDTYQFLPFGGGARSCLGRRIALATLERVTGALLATAEPVLARPQWLDWRMDVTLLPSTDPVVRFEENRQSPARSHALSGPAAAFFQSPYGV